MKTISALILTLLFTVNAWAQTPLDKQIELAREHANADRQVNAFFPAQKVLRIVQIENKLDAAQQMQLAAEIPLVR